MTELSSSEKGLKAAWCRRLLLACILGLCCLAVLGRAHLAYAYEKTMASIPVSIQVSGDSAGVYPEFEVKIVPDNAASAAALSETSFTAFGAADHAFMAAASAPAEYSYTVSETKGTAVRWTYDETVYKVVVQFWNTPTGKLEPHVFVSQIDADGKKVGMAEGCTFTNVCTTLPLAFSDPPITKRISGDAPSESDAFTFIFESIDGAPLPEGVKDGKVIATIAGEGSYEFGTTYYTAPGTYQYRCYEVNKGLAGYTYDTTIYTVTVEVTVTVDGLEAKHTIVDQDGKEASGFDFVNEYTAPKAPDVPETPKEPTAPAVQASVKPQTNPDTSDTNSIVAAAALAACGIALVGGSLALRRERKTK